MIITDCDTDDAYRDAEQAPHRARTRVRELEAGYARELVGWRLSHFNDGTPLDAIERIKDNARAIVAGR